MELDHHQVIRTGSNPRILTRMPAITFRFHCLRGGYSAPLPEPAGMESDVCLVAAAVFKTVVAK